eukprot:scaffold41463_cov43-Cyclotella_meneghiniana.AAC.1
MSELRKSLESIQSLLSQAKSPSSLGGGAASSSAAGAASNNTAAVYASESSSPFGSSPSNNQDIFRRSNNNNNAASSVSFQSPTAGNYSNINGNSTNNNGSDNIHTGYTASSLAYSMNDTPATALAPHHSLYNEQQQQQQQQRHGSNHHNDDSSSSSDKRSSSLCNHFASPYSNHQEVRPFSSDEHGGIIGSPLSAFDEFKRTSSSGGMMNSHHGSNNNIRQGRETSLLVSPMNNTATPSTVRMMQMMTSPDNTTANNDGLSGIKTSLYGRDPTPFHYRGGGHPSPILEHDNLNNNNNVTVNNNSGTRSDSSRESSRSGRDPPAKSPFHKSFMGEHQDDHQHHPQTMNSNTTNVGTTLGMIHESTSYDDNLNGSVTSEVTGFTTAMLPRTPNQITNTTTGTTPMTNRSKNSTVTNIASPSQVHSFASTLISSTQAKLQTLWDTLGVSHEDRSAHLSEWMASIENVCLEKIATEEALVDTFRKEIDEMKSEYESCCKALGLCQDNNNGATGRMMRRDPSSREVMSLQCEYETVAGRLEGVRGAVEVATKDLVASQSRIMDAYTAMYGEEEDGSAVELLSEWKDVESDLTERRREEFRCKAKELEEDVMERTKAVVRLTVDCQKLIDELEVVEEPVGNSEDDYKIMNGLKPIMQDNEQQYSPHEDRDTRRSSETHTVVSLVETSTCMGISNSAMQRLTHRIQELSGEKNRRRAIVCKMGDSIQSLWAMLRIPMKEQVSFRESISKLSAETIRKGERELARLQELKAVMIGKLIRDQRKKIEDLWEKTNASDVEKASFDQYYHVYDDDKLTEELLDHHQEYSANLSEKLEKMKPILDLIAKREAIVSDRFELEELKKDPERLKGRNACKQLGKEEKMERRVARDLPRVTAQLEKELKKWYQENKPTSTEEQEANPTLGHFLYERA